MWHSTILSALIFTALCSAKPRRFFNTNLDPDACVCITDHRCPDGYEIKSNSTTCGTPASTCCVLSNVISTESTRIKCGRRRLQFATSQSNNGNAEFGEFPWMVALLEKKILDTRGVEFLSYKCGGSLIHPQAVLTAAHCVTGVSPKKLAIRAGEWDPRTQDEPLPHQDRNVREIIIHEDYSNSFLGNDIALIILRSPVELDEHINVVCLPDTADLIQLPCVATGFGKHASNTGHDFMKILKKVELLPVGESRCENVYRRGNPLFSLDKSVICAGGEPGQDTCSGDSGGPLVCRLDMDNTRFAQIGLTAAGNRQCGLPGIPGLYTSIRHSLAWIDHQMDLNGLDRDVYRYKP